MRIHLPSVRSSSSTTPVTGFQRLAELDGFGRHTLVDNADDADLILFTEAHVMPSDWQRRRFVEHPLRQLYPERCFAYDETDEPWCWLPGVYVSMPARSARARFQVAGAYYNVGPSRLPEMESDLLFSFVGALKSHHCRRHLVNLRHPRSVVQDTQGFVFFDPTSDRYRERRENFALLLRRSKFVLCPRGRGTSSIRLYETLAAGRVPVVISDDWASPPGPSWDRFSIRVAEDEIPTIPRRLEAIEDQWPVMRDEAKRAYAEWFAPDVAFHRIVEACLDLQTKGASHSFPPRGVRDVRFFELRAKTIRNRVRSGAVFLRNQVRSGRDGLGRG